MLDGNKQRWLETHRWLVKRMRVAHDESGFIVPIEPFSQGLRCILNAARNKATIADLSFNAVLKVSLNRTVSLEQLEHAMSTVGISNVRMNRAYRGVVPMIHWPASETETGNVGPCEYMWCCGDDNTEKSILIWIDSRIKAQVIECLEQSLVRNGLVASISDFSSKYSWFRLRGDMTSTVIVNALDECIDRTKCRPEVLELWDGFRNVKVAGTLPAGASIVLWVNRKQIDFPCSKLMGSDSPLQLPNGSAALVWSKYMNRSHCEGIDTLNPFIGNDSGDCIPIMLCQTRQGCDVIIPARSKLSVLNLWLRFVHAGAFAAGCRNETLAEFSSGRAVFPDDYPDTTAYDAAWNKKESEFEKHQNARPKSKRVKLPWSLRPPLKFVSPSGKRIRVVNPEQTSNLSNQDFVMTTLQLCNNQPKGAAGWVGQAACIYEASNNDYKEWLEYKHSWEGVKVGCERKILGCITSSLGDSRLKQGSLKSPHVDGHGFCLAARMLELLGKRKSVFVLFRNPVAANKNMSYSVGFLFPVNRDHYVV
eukprot:CAMPEP_0203747390 /NCGR_PEP_ID=MMETSP0098-20131031/2559_1 /ASSEMBLY_ACC=CAM_ASM_000208 /TAXON_ID=96639 /ORGANISM=" , Strain NY0313808BC1" /LENGTH=534 /DNA_ID=CAMNT_0050635805 /DNA_START=787 /DNA_END=2391 /DNA_ORIENTATION=+